MDLKPCHLPFSIDLAPFIHLEEDPLASIQAALMDADLLKPQNELAERVGRFRSPGLIWAEFQGFKVSISEPFNH